MGEPVTIVELARKMVMLPMLDQLREAVSDEDYQTVREVLLSTVQGYKPSNGIVDLLYAQHARAIRPAGQRTAALPLRAT